MFATMREVTHLIEDDVEELKKRVEQLEACCKELREKIRPERIVPDIYRFDDELVKRLGGAFRTATHSPPHCALFFK
jgi:hypothetical protein